MKVKLKNYFKINVSKYVENKDFDVVRPASLNIPKDNAVMFINADRIEQAEAFLRCENCLVFWPEKVPVPEDIATRHAVCLRSNPHKEYCRFYYDNKISYLPPVEDVDLINGSYIAKKAKIGNNCRILPGCYIGGEVEIGDGCYIGSGTRLVGEVRIGNNVRIGANAIVVDDIPDNCTVVMNKPRVIVRK